MRDRIPANAMNLSEAADEPRTLIELLGQRASRQPGRSGYSFLADGERESDGLTYGELDGQARAIAAALADGKAHGQRVLLLYPPGLEFVAAFFGCLYAGGIAVPAYPPDPARLERSLTRLRSIVADAQASAVLTTSTVLSMADLLFAHAPELRSLFWLATDEVRSTRQSEYREAEVSSDSLAMIQYTSGSTGTAKGVMLSHANLLHNASLVHLAVEHKPGDKYVSWLPAFHDMGFMAGILEPLRGGFQSILMPPFSFLQKPARWLKAISRYKATISGGPNFAYDLCVRRISSEERAALDLSSWSVAFNGAEPVRSETLERFATTFAPCGFRPETFYPCYGLAEATLIVSGGLKSAVPIIKRLDANALEKNLAVETGDTGAANREMVGCGRVLPGQSIVVVHPESLVECSPGAVGEIWIAGPSVAQGYWNRPEETSRIFQARIADRQEGPFLRTGDLGFFREGELFVTGRLKDLIIIRGLNHYPQDIELTVEQSHAALRPGCGAAFSIDASGEERLVIVQEIDSRQADDFDAVAACVRQAVAEQHELQIYAVAFLRPGSIPKTSSGKIQRHACRKGFLDGSLEEIQRDTLSARDATPQEDSLIRQALLAIEPEKRAPILHSFIREQVAQVLSLNPSSVKPEQRLTALGLDSLMAVELKNRLENNLRVVIPVGRFLEGCRITELAEELLEQVQSPTAAGPAAIDASQQSRDDHPLSYIQQAFYFLHQLSDASPAYNVPFAVHIFSEVDAAALRRAIDTLVARHASLRTTYGIRDGQPFQSVHPHMTVPFEHSDASAWSRDELKRQLSAEAYTPFDLEAGPVLRARLFTRSAKDHILLLNAHHIAIDGWSFWMLLDELGAAYGAHKSGRKPALAAPALQYTDYVRWQADMLDSREGDRLWEYWREALAGELPVLNLPIARRRPPIQTYNGASHYFTLGGELVERLRAIAKAEGATLYMALVAGFQSLLYRYCGQSDIVIGSPVSARSRAEFEGVAGCFFNAVALRANLADNPPFNAFLRQMQRKIVASLYHQDYPSHLLAERLQVARDASRPALFQVTFILQKPHRFSNVPLSLLDDIERQATEPEKVAGADTEREMSMHEFSLGGLSMKLLPLEKQYVRTDLEVEVIESDGSLSGWLHYNTNLFDGAAIAEMAERFRILLESIAADPRQRVGLLPLLDEAEQQKRLAESSGGEDYSSRASIHELFAQQAMKTGDKIVAVFGDRSLTYRQLNEQADQLASLLQEVQH